MAQNLYKLHKLFPKEGYGKKANTMLAQVQNQFVKYAQGYANWLHLTLFQQDDFYEIAIVGDAYKSLTKELLANYLPNAVIVADKKEDPFLELLTNRHVPNQSLIYVCIEGSCKLPVTEIQTAMNQLD